MSEVDTFKRVVSYRLRCAREASGMSRYKLGQACSISTRTIEFAENEQTALNLRTATTLCKVLGVSLDWLVGESEIKEVAR